MIDTVYQPKAIAQGVSQRKYLPPQWRMAPIL
jgi:hypothetical protein